LIRRGHEQGEITKNHDAASLSAARADWNLERLQVAVGEALAHLDAEQGT